MTPAAVDRLADAFWERVGDRPPPPRDLEAVVAAHCAVFVRGEAGLTPARARDWFCRFAQTAPPTAAADRPALGCVLAYKGRAAIFVDEGLSSAVRRVVVAHEVGHYLAEYLGPRQRVLRRLGPSVLPVLDAARPGTVPERWAAALAGVRLGAHAHYLERGYAPAGTNDRDHAERTANAVALELLAPARWVRAEAGADADAGRVADLLTGRYGLPADWAAGYAAKLAAAAGRSRPMTARWGL